MYFKNRNTASDKTLLHTLTHWRPMAACQKSSTSTVTITVNSAGWTLLFSLLFKLDPDQAEKLLALLYHSKPFFKQHLPKSMTTLKTLPILPPNWVHSRTLIQPLVKFHWLSGRKSRRWSSRPSFNQTHMWISRNKPKIQPNSPYKKSLRHLTQQTLCVWY